MSLAARFKARRLELGMTQVEVANSAGVSQQSIESMKVDGPESLATFGPAKA